MEIKTQIEEVNETISDIADAKSGKDTQERIKEAAERESPLDEARRLNRETKELSAALSKLKSDMEELAAFNALSGRAVRQVGVTPEEQRKQTVDALAKALMLK